jgi:hypothetical protein
MVPDLQQPGTEVALSAKTQKPEYTKGPVSPLLHWYQWYQCTRGTTNIHLANPHQKPTQQSSKIPPIQKQQSNQQT